MTALAPRITRRPSSFATPRSAPEGGGSRLPAALALLAAPLHVAVLVMHPHGLVTTVVLLAMTAWCALCGARLLRGHGTAPASEAAGTLRMLLVSAAAMVLAHAALVAGLPGIGAGHHHDGGAAATAHDAGATRAMLGIVVLELGVGLTSALALRRTSRD